MHVCTHLTSPYHTMHTWKQTQRLDVQNVEVSGVESLTRLTNRPLCSHQLTTPLSTDTGLFEPHCLTYQLSVDTTQAGSRSTDCNLYQTGTASILKTLWAHSGTNQNRFKMGLQFSKFSCSYQEGNIFGQCENSSEGRNRLFKCSKISLTLAKSGHAARCLLGHTWHKSGPEFSRLVSQHHGQRPRHHSLTSGAPSHHTNQEKTLERREGCQSLLLRMPLKHGGKKYIRLNHQQREVGVVFSEDYNDRLLSTRTCKVINSSRDLPGNCSA